MLGRKGRHRNEGSSEYWLYTASGARSTSQAPSIYKNAQFLPLHMGSLQLLVVVVVLFFGFLWESHLLLEGQIDNLFLLSSWLFDAFCFSSVCRVQETTRHWSNDLCLFTFYLRVWRSIRYSIVCFERFEMVSIESLLYEQDGFSSYKACDTVL